MTKNLYFPYVFLIFCVFVMFFYYFLIVFQHYPHARLIPPTSSLPKEGEGLAPRHFWGGGGGVGKHSKNIAKT